MGLGISSNLDSRAVPPPYRLLEEHPSLFDYVEYSAPLSLAEARRDASLFSELWNQRSKVPVLFHPVHLNLYGPTLESADALRDLAEHLSQVGSPWVSNDVAWWHQAGQPFPAYFYLPPPFDRRGLDDCTAHALHVQASIPVPLLLENPAVIAWRGDMHVLDFMAELHLRTGSDLLLDIGHLFSYQLTQGIPISSGLDGFPLESVVEIHIAGGLVSSRGQRRYYVDDHAQPVRNELLDMLQMLIPLCPRLRAVTFEADGQAAEVAVSLFRRLRPLIPRRRQEGASVQVVVERHQPPGAPSAEPWDVFDQAYGRLAEPVDPTGAAAELDFRLAVIAFEVDQRWPLSRLLLAGRREELSLFAASSEFRSIFEGPGKDLNRAFSAFARRRLREAPDDGVAAVLAFETWLIETPSPPPAVPKPGCIALANGVAVRTFPIDLSELQFAASSVKKHLLRRAWATGIVEDGALESLRQVARRAPSRPWTVATRHRGRTVEVINLTDELIEVLGVASGEGRRAEIGPTDRRAAAAREALRLGLITLTD